MIAVSRRSANAAARARQFQRRQLGAGEHRDQPGWDRAGLYPGHRVRDVLLGREPLEELLQARYRLLA